MHDSVAVIGLGNMGAGIARTLAQTGRSVLGVDPAPEAAARVDDLLPVVDLDKAVADADVLVLSLPGSEQVEQLVDRLLEAEPGHRLVVDTSTSSPVSTRALEQRLTRHGHSLLDAPVSGGPAGAQSGSLTVFLGGRDDAVAEAEDVLAAIAQRVVHVGGPGAGNVAKLVNNLLCATHLQIAGEALRLAEAADIDPARVVEAVNGASGRSAVTEVNLPRWVLSETFDSGFPLGLMARDVALATETARSLGTPSPLADVVSAAWRDTRDRLGAAEDFNRMAQPERTQNR
ncbi:MULTISPECIES: NAD(P)-dependent oxidoreductase [Prauserella salsuginis group]|uniref:NAD(P)-dependent oxidoreductase n=1 Tax=Prauserella salsuginis TaxID=387889 RepID=A0ABW6G087_9PSEU|nr:MULTISPECIES: NAD(P)-dependent oxidoreductase [Prauserella salsuginis group]MCR3721223.1 3-hydroxyisobutyrate dehydrogenase [Prauserella flava]MCR3734696.1 3-hydroxyisobutyrate dehydrogenase [Prauserella salsuginis]